jgi:hypothetical protein
MRIPFPLFHGTSTHHVHAFPVGRPPEPWPFRNAALSLLREAWKSLVAAGQEPEWHVEQILEQASGRSNWQHGQLYVTASRCDAVRYAGSNAGYGGELLTACGDALERLNNPLLASELLVQYSALSPFLRGGGKPLLIELTNISEADLMTPERQDDDAKFLVSTLRGLADQDERDLKGQQSNFRLPTGVGTVSAVFEVVLEDRLDPISRFSLRCISRCR